MLPRRSQHAPKIRQDGAYIGNATKHFNQPGHSKHNLKATVLEKVNVNSQQYRKEREHYFIRRFNTYYKGLNKQK